MGRLTPEEAERRKAWLRELQELVQLEQQVKRLTNPELLLPMIEARQRALRALLWQ